MKRFQARFGQRTVSPLFGRYYVTSLGKAIGEVQGARCCQKRRRPTSLC
jgi:hypothetical protein